jgi:hypothetical protein
VGECGVIKGGDELAQLVRRRLESLLLAFLVEREASPGITGARAPCFMEASYVEWYGFYEAAVAWWLGSFLVPPSIAGAASASALLRSRIRPWCAVWPGSARAHLMRGRGAGAWSLR